MDDLDVETLLLLRAARETGVLEALVRETDTVEETAAVAGVDERAARLTVEVLLAEGFLARVGDAVEPTNRLLGFLAAADLRSVGRLPDRLDALDALAELPDTMQAGKPATDGDRTHRLGARGALDEATIRAVVTAAIRAAPESQRVLDVEGSPGSFATEFAARGREVTLADRPDALDPSRSLLAVEPVDLVSVESGEPLPEGFDLVFAADTTPTRNREENCAFVARLADAASEEGTVVLVDRLWDRSENSVPATIEAYARHGGELYSESVFREWFEAAGLGDPEIRQVPGTDRYAVVGTHT